VPEAPVDPWVGGGGAGLGAWLLELADVVEWLEFVDRLDVPPFEPEARTVPPAEVAVPFWWANA
jgi:hypothetical protein